MIDTRLCETEEELQDAFAYERLKSTFKVYESDRLDLEMKIKKLQGILKAQKSKVDRTKRMLEAYEFIYKDRPWFKDIEHG